MEPLSPRNARVRAVRHLARQPQERAEQQEFVIEGPGLTADALDAGLDVRQVFYTGDAPRDLVDRCLSSGADVHEVAPAAIGSMATTVTPQPLIAVSAMPARTSSPGESAHVVVLDAIQDPGNAGTILRSAEASGAALVVFGAGCVDVFSPKVVRSSAGAVFRASIDATGRKTTEVIAELSDSGRKIFGAVRGGAHDYDEVDLRTAVLVLGNEAHGLADDTSAAVDDTIAIPQHGDLESLNVAMAATVLCFEAARQRRVRS